ncbi:MAG: hypothetical protein ABIP95_00250 [Pelobium sp.]
MKKLLHFTLILFFVCLTSSIIAQSKTDDATKSSYVFCELIAKSTKLNTKTRVAVDFGLENPKFKDTRLKDEDTGKIKTFNSMIDALNYMSEKGWEFVQAYVTVDEKDSTTHWLLKMKDE